MTGAALYFENLGFRYGDVPVLERLDLTLPAGTVTALMGPSGCGKSTALAIAAGLLAPCTGTVHGRPHRTAIVFQDPLLLPWRNARTNVAFALKAEGMPPADRADRADVMLANVGLTPEDAGKYPRQLSGGMRMRVALARALAIAPDLLLLDEAFAALDRSLAQQMLALVRAEVDTRGAAALIVTHDPVEAARIADRVVLLSSAPARVIASRELPGRAGGRTEAQVAAAVEALLAVEIHGAFRAAAGGQVPSEAPPSVSLSGLKVTKSR